MQFVNFYCSICYAVYLLPSSGLMNPSNAPYRLSSLSSSAACKRIFLGLLLVFLIGLAFDLGLFAVFIFWENFFGENWDKWLSLKVAKTFRWKCSSSCIGWSRNLRVVFAWKKTPDFCQFWDDSLNLLNLT